MKDEEINQACAKALGMATVIVSGVHVCPDFCNDANAAAMLRDEVAKRGLEGKFGAAIASTLPLSETGTQRAFAFINASPRTQALAFLEVVKP